MSFSRPQRHRPDNNQSSLVTMFEELGGLWIPYASKPFDGWGWHAKWAGYMPIEIKDPKKEGHADEYTPRQRKVMQQLKEAGARWLTWRSQADVLISIGARKSA
jgi:hypothetical protein